MHNCTYLINANGEAAFEPINTIIPTINTTIPRKYFNKRPNPDKSDSEQNKQTPILFFFLLLTYPRSELSYIGDNIILIFCFTAREQPTLISSGSQNAHSLILI